MFLYHILPGHHYNFWNVLNVCFIIRYVGDIADRLDLLEGLLSLDVIELLLMQIALLRLAVLSMWRFQRTWPFGSQSFILIIGSQSFIIERLKLAESFRLW